MGVNVEVGASGRGRPRMNIAMILEMAADTYGDRILGIYEQILGWLTDRAKI